MRENPTEVGVLELLFSRLRIKVVAGSAGRSASHSQHLRAVCFLEATAYHVLSARAVHGSRDAHE